MLLSFRGAPASPDSDAEQDEEPRVGALQCSGPGMRPVDRFVGVAE